MRRGLLLAVLVCFANHKGKSMTPPECSKSPSMIMAGSVTPDWRVYVLDNAQNTKPPNAIRLLSADQSQAGVIWHNQQFTLKDFYIESTIEIGNDTINGDGDGATFVFANMASITNTSVAVNSPLFTGLFIFLSPFYKQIFGDFVAQPSTNALRLFTHDVGADLKNKVTYQIRIANTNAGQRLTMQANIAFSNGTNKLITPATNFPIPDEMSSLFDAPGLFFGVKGFSGGCADSVDVFDIFVFGCTAITTTTTTSSRSTKTSTTASTTTSLEIKPTTITLPPTVLQPVGKTGNTEGSAVKSKIETMVQASTQQLQKSIPEIEETDVAKTNITQLFNVCTDFSPDRAAPPPSSRGSVTTVKPQFAVDRLVEIDTVRETIRVAGTMLLSWTVTTCQVKSDDIFTKRPPEQIYVATSRDVWTPAFRFVNSASTNKYMQNSDEYGDDLLVAMSREKNAPNRTLDFYWIKDGTFSSECSLNLARFPFDKQTCLFSFALIRSVPLVTFSNPEFYWQDKFGTPDNEWEYQGNEQYLASLYYKGRPTSTIHYSVAFKRNSGYYVWNLIVPNIVLIIVEIGSFLLPPKAPDRPTFSITVLLAITVSQSALMNQVPKTSQRILLCDYVTALSWLCAGCTFYQLLMCWYANKGKKERGVKESHPASDVDSKIISLPEHQPSCCKKMGVLRICDWIAALLAIGAFVGIQLYYIIL